MLKFLQPAATQARPRHSSGGPHGGGTPTPHPCSPCTGATPEATARGAQRAQAATSRRPGMGSARGKPKRKASGKPKQRKASGKLKGKGKGSSPASKAASPAAQRGTTTALQGWLCGATPKRGGGSPSGGAGARGSGSSTVSTVVCVPCACQPYAAPSPLTCRRTCRALGTLSPPALRQHSTAGAAQRQRRPEVGRCQQRPSRRRSSRGVLGRTTGHQPRAPSAASFAHGKASLAVLRTGRRVTVPPRRCPASPAKPRCGCCWHRATRREARGGADACSLRSAERWNHTCRHPLAPHQPPSPPPR